MRQPCGRLCVIPDATIKGCAFHWGQAVWLKAQELGLQVAYQEDKDIFNFIRKLLALPFLPAEHITDMFKHIKQINTHNLINARPISLMQNTGTDSESSIASFIQHDYLSVN